MWQGVMCGRGGACVGGMHDRGVHGRVCMAGVMRGRGVCVAGGMHGGGYAWLGGVHGWGYVWIGGVHGRGGVCSREACVAGEGLVWVACMAGVCMAGVCMAGVRMAGVMRGRGHAWQGGMHDIQWMVRILLECILVSASTSQRFQISGGGWLYFLC